MMLWTEIPPWSGVRVRITAGENGIRRVEMNSNAPPQGGRKNDHPLLADAASQIGEYGSLGGYRPGPELKRRILALEGHYVA